MHNYQAAKLKLEDRELTRVLDILDAADRQALDFSGPAPARFSYRVRALHVEVQQSRDVTTSYFVPTRNIGPDGISLLFGNLVHKGTPCTLHLVSIGQNVQVVRGKVAECRYVADASGVHEVSVQFDRAVDPGSFASAAVRMNVLVADDSRLARRLLEHLLRGLNVEVMHAANGIEAVEQAQRGRCDMILMDLEMPELDGLAAVRVLREKGYLRPIVAVSSLDGAKIEEQCMQAGCNRFVTKADLRARLATIVMEYKPAPLVSAMLHDTDMQPLIDEFVSDLPQRVHAFETAFAGDDLPALVLEIRKLKGEAAGYGFEPLSDAAGEVEQAIAAKLPGAQVQARLSQLVQLCSAARPASIALAAPRIGTPRDADSLNDLEAALQ